MHRATAVSTRTHERYLWTYPVIHRHINHPIAVRHTPLDQPRRIVKALVTRHIPTTIDPDEHRRQSLPRDRAPIARAIKDMLWHHNIQEETIFTRARIHFLRDIRVRGDVGRLVELGAGRQALQEGRLEILFPEGFGLGTDSAYGAILDMRPVLRRPNGSAKAQVAQRRRGIANVAKVVGS